MENVIVIQNEDKIEVYSSLTKMCKNKDGFSYHYLRSKKFPFEMYGWRFLKIKLNKTQIIK